MCLHSPTLDWRMVAEMLKSATELQKASQEIGRTRSKYHSVAAKPYILVSNINKHLALDSNLADCQHGFRSQRSCETQLVQFVHDIISNLDGAVNRGHKQTDLIMMDFAKAFDTVPHRRLLHKLDYYGIRGSTHEWIISRLSRLTQQVVLQYNTI